MDKEDVEKTKLGLETMSVFLSNFKEDSYTNIVLEEVFAMLLNYKIEDEDEKHESDTKK